MSCENPLSCAYIVEVYEPNSADDVLISYELEQPPAAIHEGDLLTIMSESGNHHAPLNVLRVTRVSHILWHIDEAKNGVPRGYRQKLMVFTTALENTREILHDKTRDKKIAWSR